MAFQRNLCTSTDNEIEIITTSLLLLCQAKNGEVDKSHGASSTVTGGNHMKKNTKCIQMHIFQPVY